ncbi:nucleotide sugar dehydrogenase [Hypoxylon sp. FL1284]|nr:nucleotide sugar dehydrogenase [Hypoxylon sp. FL1284]
MSGLGPNGLFADDFSSAPTTPSESLSSSHMEEAAVLDNLEDTTRPVKNICCVGAGYVGGPTAAVMAYMNPHLRVTVVDKNAERIRRWNSQHLPIYEPGLGDIVRIARDGSRPFRFINEPTDLNRRPGPLTPSDSSLLQPEAQVTVPARPPNLIFSIQVGKFIGEADIVLIAVNTPTKVTGVGAGRATDMAYFEAIAGMVAMYAREGAIIVEKSTVPCRTADMVRKTMAIHRPGVDFEILSNPEFLAAGTAMKDLMYPDRVLIGCSPTSSGHLACAALAQVYSAWVPRSRILTTNVYSSELAKLVANSMLAQRISSINSISAICEKTGANVDEVADSIGSDPRIGDKFLKAGIGFGGSCFKKDIMSLVYLAESFGLDEVSKYWRQVVVMNEYQRDRFAKRVIACLNNTLSGKKVTLLGYAFKANTSDTRESPALEIIKMLLVEGPKEIAIYDPCCNPRVVKAEIRTLIPGEKALKEDGGPVVVYSGADKACASSHAVLITTEFDEFRNTSAEASGTKRDSLNSDPRPLGQDLGAATETDIPTEMEILALHNYLLGASSAAERVDDPLGRYVPEPTCDMTCPDCGLIRTSGYSTAGNSGEGRPKTRLDWPNIARHMNKPKWLFDGKGIVNVEEMKQLGIRVESIGR